jgi:hypothetical protein
VFENHLPLFVFVCSIRTSTSMVGLSALRDVSSVSTRLLALTIVLVLFMFFDYCNISINKYYSFVYNRYNSIFDRLEDSFNVILVYFLRDT